MDYVLRAPALQSSASAPARLPPSAPSGPATWWRPPPHRFVVVASFDYRHFRICHFPFLRFAKGPLIFHVFFIKKSCFLLFFSFYHRCIAVCVADIFRIQYNQYYLTYKPPPPLVSDLHETRGFLMISARPPIKYLQRKSSPPVAI